MNVKLCNDIIFDKLFFDKPEKMGSSYFSSLSYDGKPLYIQTERVRCNIDYSDLVDKKNPHLDVQIPLNKLNIYDFFINLDDKNIKSTFNSSKEWFGKDLPLDAIDDMYKRITRPIKKNCVPELKFKLPMVKNNIQCSIYNQNKSYININELKKGLDVILILHIRGLKILKQYYFCDLYVSQIKLFTQRDNKYNILADYSIIEKDEGVDIFDDIEINKVDKKKGKKSEKNSDIDGKEDSDIVAYVVESDVVESDVVESDVVESDIVESDVVDGKDDLDIMNDNKSVKFSDSLENSDVDENLNKIRELENELRKLRGEN
jgi:hypothetical protein